MFTGVAGIASTPMGTEKRERQKANRAMRDAEVAKAERASAVKRNAIRWTGAIVAAFAAVLLIAWFGGAFDGDDDTLTTATIPTLPAVETTTPDAFATTVPSETDATTPTDTAPTDTAPAASAPTDTEPGGEGECPATDGSEDPRQEFDEYPPMCIDETKTYTAEIVTTQGAMTVELFTDKAPITVNSFVTLARYHYFDGVPCHRIIPGFVAQCGDPTGTGTGGPGYEFEDELPAQGEYEIGSLAMANAGPNTNGSQFFIITGPDGAALPPSYSLFGMVTDGLDTTVPALDAVGNPDPAAGGVPPLEPVDIISVTITES
jgi:cyclophilin family peptidyl-prolyl cis-trans isomerase